MPAELRGGRALRTKLRRMYSRRGLNRITSEPLENAIDIAHKQASRRNWGFTDRTHALRASLEVEQVRDERGRYQTGVQLVASTPYARFVEWKRRSRDRRPGPPYWLNRAFALAQRRMMREIRRELTRNIGREARKR